MKRFFGIAAVLASLAFAAPATSLAQGFGLLLPAVKLGDGSVLPITLEHFAVSQHGDVTDARLLLPYRTESFSIDTLAFSFDADPFLNFNVGIQMLADTPITFTILWGSPFVGGPYAFGTSDITATITDGLRDGASLTATSDQAQIDLAGVGLDLAFDCAVPSSQPGGSNTCSDSAAGAILTGPSGNMYALVQFTVSGLDLASIDGTFTITATEVPEPSGLAVLLGAGLLGLLRRRR